ncbi:MAG: ATP synthase F0 subunit B [Deltaproteobacteria bacterium]|nr:ATP synthase F0 subunit B [Deltaproteobacteria bacterium]
MGNRTGKQWVFAILMALGLCLLLVSAGLAEEAAHGDGHGGISPAKIYDFTWRTVNFLLFAGILVYLLVKKVDVKGVFAKRSQAIAETLETLESKKAQAAAALKEMEARLAEVAKEREAIIKQYMAEGEIEKSKILDKANQVAARIKEMATLSIQQETLRATQELKKEVADMATKMAEDLIKEKATFADQQVLVEEYLKKVVEAH